ncbi:MAG: L,D-transpeptidase family protein [Lachnospiraceae bacterium]|nr:L,D-transpeptidase family protein [Lachnospiraceae bacterium]
MKHKVLLITVLVITAIAAIYAGTAFFYTGHVMPGSRIAGQKADGSDIDGIVDILKDSASSYSLEIKGDTTDDVLYGKEVSLSLDDASARKAAQQILDSQKVGTWPQAFFRKNTDIEVPEMSATFDETALESAIDGLSAVTAEPTKSENATYELSGDTYKVKKEVYGTEIDRDALTKSIESALESLDETLNLRESGDYVDPEIKSDDPTLKKTVENLNKYMAVDITYDMGDKGKVKVDKEDQAKWFKVGKSGKVSFDDDAIYKYAQMTLGYKYNTMGLPRKLKTQYGTTATVKGGNYGWWINYAGERDQIKKDLKAGKSVTREPVYHYKAANHGDYSTDYGNSYAEVNIATQHMFLVINGKKVLDSDVVTGKDVPDRRTPTGTYRITYKTKDATLKGQGYASPVSWWMPFNGNIGFHDAPWRHGRFGGQIYKTAGSHGCVNMPPEMAKKLYKYVETGFPVIVYNQKETDSARKKAETGWKYKGE